MIEYNSLGFIFKNKILSTEFNFIEENGAIGSSNFVENITSISFDQNNQISFKTRKNRKLDIAEYYNLIYEYKNDCLIAGITYNKTYYEDRDLVPSEDLMFKLTLIQLLLLVRVFRIKMMYKLNLKKLFFIFIVLCLFFSKSSAIENKILFKVDNQIITTIDIFNEINYLKILNPEIQNLNEQRLFEISKNSLIREKIKKISLLKVIDEIKIPDELVDQIIISIYNNMNLNSINEYKLFLRKNNLSYNYVKNKITIERLWNEMIFQKFNSKVKIDRENKR